MASDDSSFFVAQNRFESSNLIFETQFSALSTGSDRISGEVVLIHKLQFRGFQLSDLLVFLRDLLSVHLAGTIPGILPVIGLSSNIDSFSVIYRLCDASPVDLRSLSDEPRHSLLRSVAQSLITLHSAGISHLRLKPSSLFATSNGFHLACFTPRSIVDLDPEDAELPFCGQTNSSCDIFLFGLLIFTALKFVSQAELLNQIWRFEAFETKDHPTLQFAANCLKFSLSQRPTLTQVSEHFGVSPVPLARVSESAIESCIVQSDSIFAQLLRGSILTTEGRVSEAISAYDALLESPLALNNKGKLLLSRDTTDPVLVTAVELFVMSASKGYSIGLMNAAHAFLKGVGVPRDRARMQSSIAQAADQGHLESMCIWAMEARTFDLALSARYLRGAARKAEPQAIHMYGLALESGIGFPGEHAVDYFRVGAALGYPHSLNNLGTHAPNFETANALWRRAAETGLRHACYNLAVSYKLGRGIERNEREAARWMKCASDQGFPNAMFDFAMMLRDGIGVEKDEEAADELCERAAERRTIDFEMEEKSKRLFKELRHTAPK
jgi:TPR repeat protein